MLEYGTLGQIAEQVSVQIQDSSASKAVAIKGWINTHYARVARGHRWPELLRVSEERASLTAGQKYLYLPKEVEQLYLVFPQNAFGVLQGRALDSLIEEYSTIKDTAGVTVNYADAGEVGYMTDFYTAGERISISHSGTGTIEAVVRGSIGGAEGVAAGTEIVENVAVLQSTGGTTASTFTDLGAVSVGALPTGDVVTVTGVTSLRTYAKISGGERVAKYKRVRLMVPTLTADPYTLVWKKRVIPLVDDNQAVEIPVSQALVSMVVSTMLANQREYAGAQLHYNEGQREVEQLKHATAVDEAVIHIAVPAANLRRGYRSGYGW